MKKTYKKFRRKTYSPASDGPHDAVAADYLELGQKSTQWGLKEKIKLVYLLDEKDEAGKLSPSRSSSTPISTHGRRSRRPWSP
jgi:hypothetical protein